LSTPEVAIRPLEGLEELTAAVRLQEETWGAGFSERVPVSLLRVTARLGGVVSGAFDPRGTLVGFVFGMTGIMDGRLVHWSDMLAVAPELRDTGLGRRLKLHQRELVRAMGVEVMYWTFDPLESRNAWLNLGKLGAVCREYVRDMYGSSASPLHRGLGTDRLVARWELASARVERRLAGEERPPTWEQVAGLPAAFEVQQGSSGPEPGPVVGPPASRTYRVPVPADLQTLKRAAPAVAQSWRIATRSVLQAALARGGELRELVRAGGLSHYVVVTPPAETPAPSSSG
jgi:predicted GNAT superfamily acetyltransferase